MKVKILIDNCSPGLETQINEFIYEIEKEHMEVVDIKFNKINYGTYDFSYTALIMYKPDGRVYLYTDVLSPAEYHDEFGV